MIVYSLTYIISFVCLVLDNFDKNRWIKLIYTLIFALLIIIAGLKDENTCFDTNNYIGEFERAGDIGSFGGIEYFWHEPGYVFLVMLSKTLSLNYTQFFFLIAFLSLSIYWHVFWKYSSKPFLSLFIFISIAYITQIVVIIRFGLSVAIIFYAISDYMRHGNVTKFAVICFFASLFHYAALSVLLIIPFLYYRVSQYKIKVTLFVLLVLSFFDITIMKLIIIISSFLPSYLQFALSKGLQYVDSQGEGTLTQLILLIPFLFYINHFISEKNNYQRCLYDILYKGWIILLMCCLMMIEFTQIEEFSRLNRIYMSVCFLLIPLAISNLNKRMSTIVYIYTLVYCIARFVRISFFNSGAQIYVI